MKIFPSDRARQRADTRTVVAFFTAMAIMTVTCGAMVAARYLLGWW